MQKIETAVFLASGMESRIKGLNENKPIGFLDIGGKLLIEQSVHHLKKAGIKNFIFGTGHHDQFYLDFAAKFNATCIKNELYAETGSMYTLFNLRDSIKDDFLLLETDIVYDQSGIEALKYDQHTNAILGSNKTNSGCETYIETDQLSNLVNISKNHSTFQTIHLEMVGISKLSYNTYRRMCNMAERMFLHNPKLDYESVFVSFSNNSPLFVSKIEDYLWCKVTNEMKYKLAVEIIFPQI
jgi:2-aminoethylphosphonate-pyruvate transaminase